MVWTPALDEQWNAKGKKPSPVMVWPRPTGTFLDSIAGDRMYAYFHLLAYRGNVVRKGWARGGVTLTSTLRR